MDDKYLTPANYASRKGHLDIFYYLNDRLQIYQKVQ